MRLPLRPPIVTLTTLLAMCLASVVLMAPAVSATPEQDLQVASLLEQRLANPRLGGDVGIVVLDAATGAVIESHGGDDIMLPASNMKIITAVDILAAMGPDARFTTTVRSGSAPNDIILQGGGDPLLTSGALEELAARTAEQLTVGTRVTLHVDADLFPAAERAPGWPADYVPYVAAPVEALARLGDYSRTPSANAARVFTRKLRALGFKAKIADALNAPADAAVLAQTDGHSVADAVRLMLSASENNVAEVLFRQVAVAAGVEPTWTGARAAAESTLGGLGIDASAMRLLDGSGLSRRDGVSPRFLADVLRLARVTQRDRFAVMFEGDAMPVAGKTGTLASAYGRYTTRPSRCARSDVQAKTGTLFDTIGLSGRAETTSGEERLFSILVNDRPQRYSALSTRQAVDGLAATITGCWD